MLGKLDFTLLPTARDVIRVNNEIRTTELNLRDALLAPVRAKNTIAELERELEMLKAWIAPIRRLNADILSLVFEMCGEDNWKTPLRIAATSRDWRDLVLAMPRAWEFLPAGGLRDERTIRLFLERSDPRPLHFYHPYPYGTSFLSGISQRLECLTVEDFHYDMRTLSFPNLKRLVIACESDIQISRIDAARFPALRHLVCIGYIVEDSPFIDGDLLNLPPLQSLRLIVDAGSIWLSVLQACQDTLISLSLTIEGYPTIMLKNRLAFPRLMCLEIDYWPRSEKWPLDMKTPALETYIEHVYRGSIGIIIHADFKAITQLRTDRELESSVFPKVQLIQFTRDEEARLLLHHLLSNPAHCLELETIEVAGKSTCDMMDLAAAVNIKLERTISLVFASALSDLPGSIKTQLCGSNMPCYYNLEL